MKPVFWLVTVGTALWGWIFLPLAVPLLLEESPSGPEVNTALAFVGIFIAGLIFTARLTYDRYGHQRPPGKALAWFGVAGALTLVATITSVANTYQVSHDDGGDRIVGAVIRCESRNGTPLIDNACQNKDGSWTSSTYQELTIRTPKGTIYTVRTSPRAVTLGQRWP